MALARPGSSDRQVLAYICGAREDNVFLELKVLLRPFGITRFYTDGWGPIAAILTQTNIPLANAIRKKVERKHLMFWTRLKRLTRKTLGFSRSILMHDVMIGLFINRVEFGRAV